MAEMNWVDYIILAIFFFSILSGFGRGFVREVISLATWVAAVIVAIMFTNPLATYFTSSSTVQGVVSQASSAMGVSAAQPVSYVALALSFGALFGGTMLVGSLIGYFISAAFQFGALGIGNRVLGAMFGFGRGFILNMVLIFLVQLTPFSAQSWWQQSQMVASFQPSVQWLGNIVSPSLANLKDRFGKTVQDVSSQIQGMTQGIGSF